MEGLNLYQLRLLVAVVEQGSFAAAAHSLALTQPAVSAQIRHLRLFAGAPIFTRDGRGVTLTEAGRALYRYAQETLGAAEALRRELTEIGSGQRDRFVVGGSLAHATYVLPDVLASFQLTHPDAWVSVVDGSSRDMIERVRTGAIDAAVVTSSRIPRPVAAQLAPENLGTDDLVVIESDDKGFSRGEPVPLEMLNDVPFVRISGRRTLATTLDPLLSAAGLEPVRTIMELGTWEGLKSAVRSGLGAAVVFRSVVQRELDRGELRVMNVEGFAQTRGLVLICSPQRRRERMTDVFRELLAHLRDELPRAVGTKSAPALIR